MKSIEIKIVESDDWTGIYFNDILEKEGTDINYIDLLFSLRDIYINNVWDGYISSDLKEFGYKCPKEFSKLEKYIDE